ncbi:MAG: hypothetical protein HOL29_09245 [Euryarchaeota archaeon]|nr:hypothetical protein [Euryarchaeota archaeon]
MEVWGLDDLNFTDGGAASGPITFSGNVIPVEYTKSPNSNFIANSLTLEGDGISSGRRRLGMLVYVHETKLTYQYVIDDYQTLFDNAETEGSVTSTVDGNSGQIISWTVRDRLNAGTPYPNGGSLIESWLDSSIEGVSGVTRANARWRIFYGTDITVTGGTYTNGTAVFTNSTGGTFNVTGFTTGGTGTDTYLTGGTYTNSTGTLTLERNDSGNVQITGFTTGATEDTYVTGVTYNQLTKELTLGLNDGVDFNATGFAAEVTGGTYSGGSITLYKNDGTTSLITGLEILTHIGLVNDSNVSVSGATIDFVDTTTYKGAFFDYVIDDGTNYRAGTVQSVWSSTDIQFNDSSTVDIGTTNNFSWGMELDGNNALLKANILGGTWNIRIIKHII